MYIHFIHRICQLKPNILGLAYNLYSQMYAGIESEFGKKKNYEILNKHPFSINKLSIKTKTQNHCFLIHYNVIIYENETRHAYLMLVSASS